LISLRAIFFDPADFVIRSDGLHRLLWANPKVADAAVEIEERRLDLAERNIYETATIPAGATRPVFSWCATAIALVAGAGSRRARPS
jgi:hypothetical protein